MFLFPIGRDETEIRRHAWISYAILALNILAFFYTAYLFRQVDPAPFERKWEEIIAYVSENPHLRIPGAVRGALNPKAVEYLDGERRYYEANGGRHRPEILAEERKAQKKLESLVADLDALRSATPYSRFGYTPSNGSWKTMFTSMFVHGGLLHLIGNLLFFFVTGPFIEDVFGRPFFALLYFVGGVAATMTHVWQHPASEVPLIGASGAIAAVMGAYLVRFVRSKLEFLWIPFVLRPTMFFRFFLPAWVVLPLWFLTEFLQATRDTDADGVAVWAHVGGFAFGMAFAGVMKAANVEKILVDPIVEKQTTWKQNEHLVRAADARSRGDLHGAKRHYALALRQEPDNVDAARAGYDMAAETADWPYFAQNALLLLDQYLKLNDPELIRTHIDEAIEVRAQDLPERFYLRAGAFFEKQREPKRALQMYASVVKMHPQSGEALRALLQASKVQRQLGRVDEAKILLQRARSHEACTPEWAATIDTQLQHLAH